MKINICYDELKDSNPSLTYSELNYIFESIQTEKYEAKDYDTKNMLVEIKLANGTRFKVPYFCLEP